MKKENLEVMREDIKDLVDETIHDIKEIAAENVSPMDGYYIDECADDEIQERIAELLMELKKRDLLKLIPGREK